MWCIASDPDVGYRKLGIDRFKEHVDDPLKDAERHGVAEETERGSGRVPPPISGSDAVKAGGFGKAYGASTGGNPDAGAPAMQDGRQDGAGARHGASTAAAQSGSQCKRATERA